MATSLQSAVSKTLSSQGIDVNAALEAAKRSALTASNLLSSAQSVQRTISSLSSSVRSASLSDMTSTLPNVANMFSATVNNLTSTLTSRVSDSLKGLKEADNKILSLTSDAASALASPVAFITKPITDAIKGIDSLSQGTGLKNYIGNMNSTQISNLSKASGTTINNSDDVLQAIVTTTNNLSTENKNNSNYKSYMGSSITIPDTSGLTTYEASLINSIAEMLRNIDTTEDTTLIIDSGSITASENLPAYINQYIKSNSSTYLDNQVLQTQSDINESYATIVAALSNSGIDNETIYNILLNINSLNTSKKYSKYSSSTTSNDSLGTGSVNLLSSLYSAARTICPDITEQTYSQHNALKDLYDVLTQLCLDNDLTNLLEQLRNCTTSALSTLDTGRSTFQLAANYIPTNNSLGTVIDSNLTTNLSSINTVAGVSPSVAKTAAISTNNITSASAINAKTLSSISLLSESDSTENEPTEEPETPIEIPADDSVSDFYFDERTISIYQNSSREAAADGAILTYLTIQQTISSHMILDLDTDLVILIANMVETERNLAMLRQLLRNTQMTAADLIVDPAEETELGSDVIDGINTVAMTTTGTTIVDEYLGVDMRKLVQSTFYAYANEAS